MITEQPMLCEPNRDDHIRSTDQLTILVVDDAALDRRLAGRTIEKDGGLRVVYAANGEEALLAIERESPAAVVTDLQMPVMDGLHLVEEVRSRFPAIPVILMTGNGSEEIAIQALQIGAASYIPKSGLTQQLFPVLQKVLNAAKTDRRQQHLLGSMREFECRFELDNDPALVPPLIAYFQEHISRFGICDRTQRTRVAIALEEAMLNGIYHGNLELDSDLKEDGSGAFERLGLERRTLPPFANRLLRVRAKLVPEEAVFVIRDEGPGFDVNALSDPTDPANIERACGRGLLLIRTFMDSVSHNAAGNEITLIKRSGSTR
jgi:CheY-like chemotaxis protein/anti-sigma regulatory factor (Ser/Thr protein kinase)